MNLKKPSVFQTQQGWMHIQSQRNCDYTYKTCPSSRHNILAQRREKGIKIQLSIKKLFAVDRYQKCQNQLLTLGMLTTFPGQAHSGIVGQQKPDSMLTQCLGYMSISTSKRQRQEDSWSLLASQSAKAVKFSERHISKIRWDIGKISSINLQPLHCWCTYTLPTKSH